MVEYLSGNRIQGSSTADGDFGTGLKAYYKFNESSGNIVNVANTITDNSTLGTGQNITMNGDPTYSVTGTPSSFGNAVSCDGSGDYGQFGTKTDWNFLHTTGATWTINVWLKFDASVVANKQLFDNTQTADSTIGLNIRTQSSNRFRVIIPRGVGNSSTLDTDNNPNLPIPTDNAWHMYTFRWDQSSGNGVLTYNRDGANELTKNGSGNGTTTSDCTDSPRLFSQSNSVSGELDSEIAEMSIFNTVLTDAEVTRLYNSGSGRLLTKAGSSDEKTTLADATVTTDATPTYTPDMTSDTDWLDTVSDRIDNNTSTGKIDFDVHRTDTNQALSYDLGTALSNTAWTLRYKMTVDTITQVSDANRMFMGMRSISASSDASTNSDFIGWHSKVGRTGGGVDFKEFHYMTTDGSSMDIEGTTSSVVPTTTTYYITITRKTATTWSLRISTLADYTGGTLHDDISCASGTQGLQYLWIGNVGVEGGSSARFMGTIEDVKIYDATTSTSTTTSAAPTFNTRYEETDTRKIYRFSSLKDNCIAYYNFDSTSGGLVNQATTTNGFTDGLGSAVDGTVSGATTTTGKFSNCYDFDGDDYVNLGTNSGLNLLNGGTVAMWINYDSMTDKRWAGKGSNGAWEILSEGGSGTGKIKFRVKDSGSPENAISTTVLSSSTWYHVAGVYDKSAGKIKIYINGALEATTSSIGQIATVSTATYFGRNQGGNNVDGRIDDAGIWNVALSGDQISALYNSGTGKLINEAGVWKERGSA